jgi:hypothetical protein
LLALELDEATSQGIQGDGATQVREQMLPRIPAFRSLSGECVSDQLVAICFSSQRMNTDLYPFM